MSKTTTRITEFPKQATEQEQRKAAQVLRQLESLLAALHEHVEEDATFVLVYARRDGRAVLSNVTDPQGRAALLFKGLGDCLFTRDDEMHLAGESTIEEKEDGVAH